MMYPRSDSRKAFKYPEGRQLRINVIVSKSSWPTPTCSMTTTSPASSSSKTVTLLLSSSDAPLFVPDDDTKEESIELAIYNYDKRSGVFSARGALAPSFLKGDLERADVTYTTPIWWLWPLIKTNYLHADLDRVTL
jgi:hypothetical protein